MTMTPDRQKVDRDEVFLEYTKSICPVCKTVIDGEVLPWNDVLHDGPVPAGTDCLVGVLSVGSSRNRPPSERHSP